MYGQISTLAFIGIEARAVEVQVRNTPGAAAFAIVGLPDKAVAESRERVRNALHAVGLGLPYKHITVNLAPADLPKEGSHFDLPIVLAMMAAMEAVAPDAIAPYAAVGELALDGSIRAVPGTLPAAIGANAMGKGLICPAASGPEAAWASEEIDILAPPHLLSLVNHFKWTQTFSRPKPNVVRAEVLSRRPPGHQRAGNGQTRHRDRRGRQPQPADDRAAGLGQVNACLSPSLHSAAAAAGGDT